MKRHLLVGNYTLPGSDTYSFQIRLMSPIYEGTVTPVSGDVVKINANDFVLGAKLTSEHIVGRDYANERLLYVPR